MRYREVTSVEEITARKRASKHKMRMMATDEDTRRHEPVAASERRRSGPVRRAGVAVLGVVVILIGIPMIPLFGPGWLVVFTGLAILGREFDWANRLKQRLSERFRSLLGKRHPGSEAE